MRKKIIQRVTLQDVARETGYSINTVSHALRGLPDIAEATAARIRDVADAMGYAPNQVASSLRSGHTGVIAVILGNMSNPFYGIMVDTIQDAAQQAGYTLMIMCSRDDADLEYKLAEQAISRRADGILLFPTSNSQPTIRRLREANMPFVLMSRCLTPGEADSVVCDEEQGGYLATMHLIEHGARKLAYVSGSTVVFSSEQRIRGFLRACAEAGIPESDRRVCVFSELPAAPQNLDPGEPEPEEKLLVIPIDQLAALKRDGFDGLFVFCDVQAWNALSAMQNHPDISPGDFGIVSFDNIEGALSFPIPLCSVGCDYADMARKAIHLLRDRIQGNDQPPQTIVCPVDLFCRNSCRGRATTIEK